MWLGGDPEAIRHLAARLRAAVETLALDNAVVQRRLDAVEWESTAAEAFRRQSAHDFAAYERTSGSLEDVARTLDHLAATLADRQKAFLDAAAAVGRTLEDLWSEGGHAVHFLTGGLL